jgi:signal transduction histidine kinase
MVDNLIDEVKRLTESEKKCDILKNILGDKQRYEIILLSFICNSLKYTSHSGVVTVKINLIEL